MAAGILPEPGSDFGPCATACAHTDCAVTRRTAEEACRYCGKPIGYGVRIYRDGIGHAHAICVEATLESGAR